MPEGRRCRPFVRPELTEGPYYVHTGLERSDIRSDPATGVLSEGLPLALAFAVSRIDGTDCTPFEGALVAVHIHFKIRSDPNEASGLEFTSQLSSTTRSPKPCTRTHRTGRRARRMSSEGDDQLLLDAQPSGEGLAAVFPIGIQRA